MPTFERITRYIHKLNLVWDLRIPFVPPAPVAVWLVEERAQWTLIDAGPPDMAGRLPDVIADYIGDKPLGRLLLTHGHIDHVSGLDALQERWAILPIWAHEAEIPLIDGSMRYRELPSNNWMFQLFKGRLREASVSVRGVGALAEGSRVAGMTVVHAPGHTPGQIALLHERDRALICADAFMNMGGKLGAPMRVSTPDMKAARQSMRKLAALDFDLLLPSHDPGAGVRREVVLQRLRRLA